MQFIQNFLLPVLGLGLGCAIGVMLYRHIVKMTQSLSPKDHLELMEHRRDFTLQNVTRDGKPAKLTPREELGFYRLLKELGPQIDKLAKEKGVDGKAQEINLDIRNHKLQKLSVESLDTSISDQIVKDWLVPNTEPQGPGVSDLAKDYSRSGPTPKGDPDFTRAVLRKNEDFPGLTIQGSDVTPSQVSIYSSSDIHLGLTKNKIEEHYKERNTVRRKGKGLIRASRASQRNYRERC